jgi:hypothetical protein
MSRPVKWIRKQATTLAIRFKKFKRRLGVGKKGKTGQ